jgi:hypothetical protein
MARLGGVCWNVCADLADSQGVARRDTAIAMVGVTVRRERRWTSAAGASLARKLVRSTRYKSKAAEGFVQIVNGSTTGDRVLSVMRLNENPHR